MEPHEFVRAVLSYVEKVGGRQVYCASAERGYPGFGRGSFEPRLEEWVAVVDRRGSSVSEEARWRLAMSLDLELVVGDSEDHLVAQVLRRCPGRAPSS
jgi:hypothetical protein